MSQLPNVLMFTCAEYGQANIHLATAFELALAGVNAHIASFAPLRSRITRLQELVNRHASTVEEKSTVRGSVSFVECSFTPYWDAIEKHGINDVTLTHPHGVFGASESYMMLDAARFPWSAAEYVEAVKNIKEIIATIKPKVVAIDPVFVPAMDACKVMDQKSMILMPNSIKEVVMALHPSLSMLWKYPVMSSGFPYPLKWWQVPLNIYLSARLLTHFMISSQMRQVQSARKSLGIDAMHGQGVAAGISYVCAGLPELDYPFASIPGQLTPCGPIVMPFDPLERSDPALLRWLNNGPTVMINLGSHVISDEKVAREMAGALRILLDHHERKGTSQIQVLWKVRAGGDVRQAIDDIIGKETEEGRVKVVAWVDAEPGSILQHPNLICTVHHGGANSFFEGVWSGVPHVVLPIWFDTYDYANRAEFLEIGVFGNKSCAPGARAEEFGQALVRVTGNTDEARKFRTSAKRLQEVCRAKGNGRELACKAIMREMGISC